MRSLRINYRQLRDAIAALQGELDATSGQAMDFTDIHQSVAWVLAGLRHQHGRVSDLIYEAYYDAFQTDLPGDDILTRLAEPDFLAQVYIRGDGKPVSVAQAEGLV